jgi:hypothetical protein
MRNIGALGFTSHTSEHTAFHIINKGGGCKVPFQYLSTAFPGAHQSADFTISFGLCQSVEYQSALAKPVFVFLRYIGV